MIVIGVSVLTIILLIIATRQGYKMGEEEGALKERSEVLHYIAVKSATANLAQVFNAIGNGEHKQH